MINRAQLVLIQKQRYRGVSLGALEKDYIIAVVLRAMYADDNLRQVLVLKGGTALHKLYLGLRLSLDIDFTAHRPMALDELKPAVEVAGISGRVKDHRLFSDALTIQRLGYVGPLDFPNSIKIDVSFREPVLLPPLTQPFATPYFDPFPVIAMRLEEILAEKLRATLMRSAPRDVYDLWAVLTQREVDTSGVFELLPRKLATVGMVFDEAVLWSNLSAAGRTWEQELRPLVHETPDFQRVAAELRECLAGRSWT